MYYRELLRTPTGKDPVIRKFMDRWSVEENKHAKLLNRFLNEAELEPATTGRLKRKRRVPRWYTVESYFLNIAVKPFGR